MAHNGVTRVFVIFCPNHLFNISLNQTADRFICFMSSLLKISQICEKGFWTGPQSHAATSIRSVSQQNSISGWTHLPSRARARFHPGASHQPSATRRFASFTEPNRFNLRQEGKKEKFERRDKEVIFVRPEKPTLNIGGRPSGTTATLTWHHVTQMTHMTDTIADLNDSCNTSTPLSQSRHCPVLQQV